MGIDSGRGFRHDAEMATRERSPNYPAHGLTETVEMARKLYEAERRASVPPESAAKALGYTSLSGRARVKISTMRKYGLIDESGGRLRVSDLAMQILFASTEADAQAAMYAAAMKPDLFHDLLANSEASDTTLVNDLVRKGFSVDGAKAAVASFRETMRVVSSSPDREYDPPEGNETMIESQPTFHAASSGPGLMRQHPDLKPPARRQHTFVFTPPGGQQVELRIDGGPWTKGARDVLHSYFTLVESLVMTDEAITPSEATPRDLFASEPEQPSAQSPRGAQD